MAKRLRCSPRCPVARISLDTPLDVRLLAAGLRVGEALAAFDAAYPQAGGTVSFTGKVRGGDGVQVLELSHYEKLTLPGMVELAQQAEARFDIAGMLVWHRVGVMHPGDAIVLVAAAARHRRDAFRATDFCMDHLKSAAWFWKREKRDGKWRWVEPREADHSDLARWETA